MDREEAGTRAQTGEKPEGGYYTNQERITLQKFSLGRIRTLPSSIFGTRRSGGPGSGGAIVPLSKAITSEPPPPPSPPINAEQLQLIQKQINDLAKRDQEQIIANSNLISSLQQQFNVIKVAVTDLGSNLKGVESFLKNDAALEQSKANQELLEQKQAAETQYRKGAENQLEKRITGALMAPIKAIGNKLQFTLGNLMRFFSILFTGWLVDKAIDLFKADSEGNRRKFNDIKNNIIKHLLIAGGILTVLNLGFLRIATTIGSLAFKIGKFVIGNTLGKLFLKIADLGKKVASAAASFVGIGGGGAAAAEGAAVAGGAAAAAGAASAGGSGVGAPPGSKGTTTSGIPGKPGKSGSTPVKPEAKPRGRLSGAIGKGLTGLSGVMDAASGQFTDAALAGLALKGPGIVKPAAGMFYGLDAISEMFGGNIFGKNPNEPPAQTSTPQLNKKTEITPTAPSIPLTSSKSTSSSGSQSSSSVSSPQSSTIPSSSVESKITQTSQQVNVNQSSPQQTMVPAITGTPSAEQTVTPTISTPSETKVPELPTISQSSTTSAASATSTPQTAALPPPSPEMVKKFEMAWQNRNNGMVRGRIVEVWNNMTPQEQQQAITWAKSKGYDWNEMKLTPKPLPAITTPSSEVQAPTSQTSGAEIQTQQPAKIDTLPVSPVVGPAPAPKPNVIYASSNQNQKQPQTSLKSGAASEVPFIASSNPDNFYLLYSQVQYNVVV